MILLFISLSLLLIIFGIQKWKTSLYLFLIWFVLEGIFRKWIAPGYSQQLFFVKYFLLLGPLIQIFSQGIKVSKKDYPFYWVILIYLLWGLLEVLNPRLTLDPRVKILGIMTHFAFIPLILLVPRLFESTKKIINMLVMVVYISIPIFILGIFQYYSEPTSIINRYVAEGASIAVFIGENKSITRITGTFSYISTYTAFLTFSFSVILFLLFYGRLKTISYIILISAGTLGFINVLMTGSRGLVGVCLAITGFFLIFTFNPRSRRWLKMFFSLVVFLLIVVSVLSFTETGHKSYSNFMHRLRNAGDLKHRIYDTYTPYKFYKYAGLSGYGIGSTYQGSQQFYDKKGKLPYYEEELERIIIELGFIGFIIVVFLRFYLAYFTFKIYRKIKSYELKMLTLLIFIYQLPVILGFKGFVFNYIDNAIYWFLIGLLVTIIKLNEKYQTSIKLNEKYQSANFGFTPRKTTFS